MRKCRPYHCDRLTVGPCEGSMTLQKREGEVQLAGLRLWGRPLGWCGAMTETVWSTPPCKEGTVFGEQAASTELWKWRSSSELAASRREDQLLRSVC